MMMLCQEISAAVKRLTSLTVFFFKLCQWLVQHGLDYLTQQDVILDAQSRQFWLIAA